MNFGQAIEAMKAGKKVSRAGWNGKGMFVYLVRGQLVDKDRLRNEAYNNLKDCDTCGDHTGAVTINAHIDMKAADGSVVVGWLASQADMLAEDWEVPGETDNDERWKATIENARFMLEEYKKIPSGAFGAINIANLITRYDNGERSHELLEELESIE